METDARSVVLFRNSQGAIQGERLLRAEGITCKLIPAPRQFTSECGMALRFPRADCDRVRELFDRAGVAYQSIHDL